MVALICFVLAMLALPFKSKSRLEAENAALRHQLIVLRRKVRGRAQLSNNDRWFFVQLYRWFPSILQVVTILRPETLVRWDRDQIYGAVVTRRLRAMGIRDKPIAPASPWQNGFAERLIGSIRRECLDHLIVFGEQHLRRILISYVAYYNPVS
jgi:transposase InsO family protein